MCSFKENALLYHICTYIGAHFQMSSCFYTDVRLSFQHSGYVGFVRPRTLLSFMFSCSLLGYQHDTTIWDTIMYCNVGWDLLLIEIMESATCSQ